MRSERIRGALSDIAHRIDLAPASSKVGTRAAFKADLRAVYAVTRIISEASRRLPDELKARHPAIAWRQMAAAGNVYCHDYEDVAAQFVWDTVQEALPARAQGHRSGTKQSRIVGLVAAASRSHPNH
jgi:uncharacterized protein with HEPN domain